MEDINLEGRQVEALENLAAELERLRRLYEYVHGVRVVENADGTPYVEEG